MSIPLAFLIIASVCIRAKALVYIKKRPKEILDGDDINKPLIRT